MKNGLGAGLPGGIGLGLTGMLHGVEKNVVDVSSRAEFRAWLVAHSQSEPECWVVVKKGRPVDDEHLWYLDAVEEALCFGWIDSTYRRVEGVLRQRFSPRQKNSQWTELNKERARRLEQLGLMTDVGRAVLPSLDPDSFVIAPEVEAALKESGVWEEFCKFPPLYQRIRAYNVAFYMRRDKQTFRKSLERLIETAREGKMYGQWNDYGRLL